MQKEIWKDVPNYDGLYQVSNLGRIKSLNKKNKIKELKGIDTTRILKLRESKDGYLYTVFSIDKVRKTVKAHRLVAESFLDNKENKPCVNHINGIKTDNRVENLEWCTYSENTKHAVKIGLKKGVKGEKSHLSKLNINDVNNIRLLYSKGNVPQLKLAKTFNISQSQVNRIVNKKNWV